MKRKIAVIIFCVIITILTILRLFIHNTTFIGMIIRIMWLTFGVVATVLAIIHLIKVRQRNNENKRK